MTENSRLNIETLLARLDKSAKRRKETKINPEGLVDIFSKPIQFQAAGTENRVLMAGAGAVPAAPKRNLEESVVIDQINSSKITQLKLLTQHNGRVTGSETEPHVGILRENCECDNCCKYREATIHYYVEECEYNVLWSRLQQIVKDHYDFFSDNPDPDMEQKYREMMCPKMTRWISDGLNVHPQAIQIKLASELPLDHEQTFHLIFKMLFLRDPHQLFELLCLQVKAMLVAYCQKLKDIFKARQNGQGYEYKSMELTAFLYYGLNTVRKSTSKLEDLLSPHLQQFQTTWGAMNEQLFNRWVTTEVMLLIRLHPADYSEIFFEGILSEKFVRWTKTWKLLERYAHTKKEVARRKRILKGQELLLSIKLRHPDRVALWKGEEDHHDKDQQTEWKNILVHIRSFWQGCARPLSVDRGIRCRICRKIIFSFYHSWDCDCPTCTIVGGIFPYWRGWERMVIPNCLECAAPKVTGFERDGIHHISWVVFKHLPNRLEYSIPELLLNHLCIYPGQTCNRIDCMVAFNLIAGRFPREMADHLMVYYQPLSPVLRERLMPYMSPSNLCLLLYEEQQLNYTFLLSALAECYFVKTSPIPRDQLAALLKRLLKPNGRTLELDMTAYVVRDRSNLMGKQVFPEFFVTQVAKRTNPLFGKTINKVDGCEARLQAMAGKLPLRQVLQQTLNAFSAFMKTCSFFLENNLQTTSSPTAAKANTERASKVDSIMTRDHELAITGLPTKDRYPHFEECSTAEKCSCMQNYMQANANELRKRELSMLKISPCRNAVKKIQKMRKAIRPVTEREALYLYCEELMAEPSSNSAKVAGKQSKNALIAEASKKGINLEVDKLAQIQKKLQNMTLDEVKGERPPIKEVSIEMQTKFIEGKLNSTTVTDEQAEKKAAKKARQKQKKLEQTMMTELVELKERYHEEYYEAERIKAQLKSLKTMKKKDKNKIRELDLEVKKATRIATKTESAICEIICKMCESEPEFKFNYHPPPKPKVVQAPPPPPPSPPSNNSNVNATIIPSTINPSPPNNNNENTYSQFVAMQRQGVSFKAPALVRGQVIPQLVRQGEDFDNDPSKRMVTIRRETPPNAPPRVTVTSIGDVPRLLYSFVDGQMVTESGLSYGVRPPNPQPTMASKETKVTAPVSNNGKGAISKVAKSDVVTEVAKKDTKKSAPTTQMDKNKKMVEKVVKTSNDVKNASSSAKPVVVAPQKVVEIKGKGKKENKKLVQPPKPTPPEPKPLPKKTAKVRKLKPKFELTNPSLNQNKFDLLSNEDDDDDEYESQEEEVEEVPAVKKENSLPKSKQKNSQKLEDDCDGSKKDSKHNKAKDQEQQVQVEPDEEPEVLVMSKRDRRRLFRQNKKLERQQWGLKSPEEQRIERAVHNAERVAESLTRGMGKLNINADTTIEAVSHQYVPAVNQSITHKAVRRGVEVAGITLSPDISLTPIRKDRQAEMERKRAAIDKISFPMTQQYNELPARPHVIMANPGFDNHSIGVAPPPQQQFVLVNNAEYKSANAGGKPPQKLSDRNKSKKTGKLDKGSTKSQTQNGGGATRRDKASMGPPSNMVTLKNPMFQAAENAHPVGSAQAQGHTNPVRLKTSTGAIMDTPAAIIPKDNGMYTIRNPALHHAFTNGLMAPGMPQTGLGYQVDAVVPPANAEKLSSAGAAASSKAVGSEKRQKQEPWQPQMPQYASVGRFGPSSRDQQNRSFSPFNSKIDLSADYNGFGRKEADGLSSASPDNGGLYSRGGEFSAFVSPDPRVGCGSAGHNGHECEDPHPANLLNNQKYFEDAPLMNLLGQRAPPPQRYDDMAFLQNLQPGQKLNDEVTIHNINESKFLLRHQQQVPISNHVEITRVPMGARKKSNVEDIFNENFDEYGRQRRSTNTDS